MKKVLAMAVMVGVLGGAVALRAAHAQTWETCGDVREYILAKDRESDPLLFESIVCDSTSRTAIVTVTAAALRVETRHPGARTQMVSVLRDAFGLVGYSVEVQP